MNRDDISNSSDSDISFEDVPAEEAQPTLASAGPSTQPGGSSQPRDPEPVAGPSFADDPSTYRSSRPPRPHLLSSSSDESSPERRNFRHKNQKRRRIEFQNLQREPDSESPPNIPRYSHSPPPH